MGRDRSILWRAYLSGSAKISSSACGFFALHLTRRRSERPSPSLSTESLCWESSPSTTRRGGGGETAETGREEGRGFCQNGRSICRQALFCVRLGSMSRTSGPRGKPFCARSRQTDRHTHLAHSRAALFWHSKGVGLSLGTPTATRRLFLLMALSPLSLSLSLSLPVPERARRGGGKQQQQQQQQ